MDSGQFLLWVPRKQPLFTFCKGLKRQNNETTIFPVRSNQVQAYILTYLLPLYLLLTSNQVQAISWHIPCPQISLPRVIKHVGCRWVKETSTNRNFFFFLIFFIMYFPQLHFQCYPKSPPYPPLQFPTHPFPIFWPWRSPVLGHIKFASQMGLSFQWWPTRPSFDTYAARVKSSSLTRILVTGQEERSKPESFVAKLYCLHLQEPESKSKSSIVYFFRS